MAEKLTAQQKLAVTDRGGKLLVSAAAGSGKTKVLVDRLLSYLTAPESPANLDDFLIITYTKAAAAELQGKIAAKLSERIAQEPNNRHLQMQMQRLYLTKISTVHSFCTDILRQYAYSLNISGDFRVAEEKECVELQSRAMEAVLDEAYSQIDEDPEIRAFIDSQGFGRNDSQIPEILLRVYHSAKCHLLPEAWLDWCAEVGDVDKTADAGETIWGEYLISDLHAYLDLHMDALQKCVNLSACTCGMEKPTALLQDTLHQLARLRSSKTWDSVRENGKIDYGRLTFPKNPADPMLAEQIKSVRNACKKGLEKKLRRFSDSSEQVLADLSKSISSIRGLITMTRRFSALYDKLKQGYNILDFSDLEHRTLDLLVGTKRAGATRIAEEIGQRYREVMVDEYQDSNAVQDAIFTALTQKKQNCFMVGDVKQSIYQFRLADPDIFLHKYNTYVPAEEAKPGQGRKVLLSNNFRSCGAVLSAVNDVFSLCMSPKVGGLVYGEDEALKEGVPHSALNEPEIELYGVQVQQDTYAEEAAFVADRICQLLDGEHLVRDGDGYRPIVPEDIVILLRSPGSVGGEFQYALEQCGIPCISGGNTDLLQTEEVATLRALLQIISNPLQDIPLLTVLTSRAFGFTADELAAFRGNNRNISIYESLCNSQEMKVKSFLQTLSVLRKEARISNIGELLERIFMETGIDSIYSAMPDGTIRVGNIYAFSKFAADYESCGKRDLDQFLEHLNAIADYGLSVEDEQDSAGAVRIMSIHKSKGLEFPVVLLAGLAREFNRESMRAQVLCDKTLGLGLSCVDAKNRVRYPSVAKRAIAVKMAADSLSEEMRILYVAMTRAKDRLIMTYASGGLDGEIADIAVRMDITQPHLLTCDVDCPGKWILFSALKRTEAGELYAKCNHLPERKAAEYPWSIHIVEAECSDASVAAEETGESELLVNAVEKLSRSLSFRYAHPTATKAPSKQTATQLKGRLKDSEAAEDTAEKQNGVRKWRKPSFISTTVHGKDFGTAIHAVMQYIQYENCSTVESTQSEIQRLVAQGYISAEHGDLADSRMIASFFASPIGKKLQKSPDVLREFKFSLLDSAKKYIPNIDGEEVLLQGVVDCVLIEPDGITVLDFKTDRVNEETLPAVAERYSSQVQVYANAMERIFQKPIKSKMLYFFRIGQFVELQ